MSKRECLSPSGVYFVGVLLIIHLFVLGVVMIIQIPMKLPSLANMRLHWTQLRTLKADQKQLVKLYIKRMDKPLPPLPATITLVRLGMRMMDSDNLASAFKAVRDAIADVYGVDDGDPAYTWVYEQWVPFDPGVEIEIESR